MSRRPRNCASVNSPVETILLSTHRQNEPWAVAVFAFPRLVSDLLVELLNPWRGWNLARAHSNLVDERLERRGEFRYHVV